MADNDGNIMSKFGTDNLATVEDTSPGMVKGNAQLLTGGTIADIITIVGGPIEVVALIGEIMTAVSNNACNLSLTMDPAAGADTAMCAVVNIQAAVINTWAYITGTIADAMVLAVPGVALPLAIGKDIPLILPPGTVDMTLSNNAPTTGAVTWYMRFKPMASGILVSMS